MFNYPVIWLCRYVDCSTFQWTTVRVLVTFSLSIIAIVSLYNVTDVPCFSFSRYPIIMNLLFSRFKINFEVDVCRLAMSVLIGLLVSFYVIFVCLTSSFEV